MNTNKRFEAFLIMLGVAYVKMTAAITDDDKQQYQFVIDCLMKEMKTIK